MHARSKFLSRWYMFAPERKCSEPYLQQKALASQVLSSFSDAEARDGFCSDVSGSSHSWTSCGSLRTQMCHCPEGLFANTKKMRLKIKKENLMTLFVSLSVRNRVKDDPTKGATVSHPFMRGLVNLILKKKIHLMVWYDYDQSFHGRESKKMVNVTK